MCRRCEQDNDTSTDERVDIYNAQELQYQHINDVGTSPRLSRRAPISYILLYLVYASGEIAPTSMSTVPCTGKGTLRGLSVPLEFFSTTALHLTKRVRKDRDE